MMNKFKHVQGTGTGGPCVIGGRVGWGGGGCLGLGLKGLLYGDATNGIMNSDHMGPLPMNRQTDRQTGLKILPSPLSFPKQGKKVNS